MRNLIVDAGFVAVEEGRCTSCRRDRMPLWRLKRKLVCASCYTRSVCTGGEVVRFRGRDWTGLGATPAVVA